MVALPSPVKAIGLRADLVPLQDLTAILLRFPLRLCGLERNPKGEAGVRQVFRLLVFMSPSLLL